MPPNFMALSTQLDVATDATFGEAIRLEPYKKGYMTEPVPDAGRAIITGVGQLISRGTMLKMTGDAEVISKRAVADLLISVRDIYLTNIRQGDHIVMLDRLNQAYEISYIEDGVNTRRLIHLLKVKP